MGVPRDRCKVRIVMQKRCSSAYDRHRDQAVTETSERLSGIATGAIDDTSLLEIGQSFERQDLEAEQP